DCLSSKGALGRSVLTVGNFAPRDSLPPRMRQEPFRVGAKIRPFVPFDMPNFALNHASVRAFNAAIYLRHPDSPNALIDWETFFYPLDSIHNWNRIYGKRGFIQYQCVFPIAESRAGLVELLEAISASWRASFLA